MYFKDPVALSLIWGRIGAAVLALVAFGLGLFGYVLTPEDQSSMVATIGTFLSGLAGVLVIISKVREGKKIKE